MKPKETDNVGNLRDAFASTPPREIAQEPFEGNPEHLRRLARLRPGDQAEVADLLEYAHDLLYTDIQDSLLGYLLPFCLEAWRHDLRRTNNTYGGFVEHFYPVLANRQLFDSHLNSRQTAAVSEFMRESILEEIDDQRGLTYQGMNTRPYRWIGALTSYGVLLPDIEQLWTDWWSIETVGRAVATVQYISCLMYPENENPVFAAWTADAGGGPPCLWEFEGHLYTHRWLDANVRFLKENLRSQEVAGVLDRAVARLLDSPEHKVAEEVRDDFPLCAETVIARCNELPRILETTQEPGKLDEWST
jgi:hypothetical protein